MSKSRAIILDTETTGLDFKNDRIIEIGCVELINDVPSGRTFHKYFNPGNIKISPQSEEIHGLTNSFLQKFKLFDDSVDEVFEFIGSSQIIIHNAQFDISMINSSLERLSRDLISLNQYICTLVMARKKFPGSKVNLNALCRRFGISIEHREKHDAVTDCFLLAQVYIELIGGKQHKFEFSEIQKNNNILEKETIFNKYKPPLIEISNLEIRKHKEMRKKIKNSLWDN